MWIKCVREKPYNSLEVRNFKPKEVREFGASLGKHLLEKFPEWFKVAKPPKATKEESKVVKVEEVPEDKSAEKDKDKKEKNSINIEVKEEVKKK